MTTDGIMPIRAKLNRASLHADDFASKWTEFSRQGIYSFNMKLDSDPPHALHFWWRVRDRTADEEEQIAAFGLIYGDILSNLRGALDYLAWQLVLAAGEQPTDRTSFPCVNRANPPHQPYT